MDNFFYWSGIAAWGALAILGALAIGDRIMDWAVEGLWSKREFLAFVADRLRNRPARNG